MPLGGNIARWSAIFSDFEMELRAERVPIMRAQHAILVLYVLESVQVFLPDLAN
ncbi:MAG: hypothetical protein P4M13_10690 [Alphaproteobacteria bacterium]|nr:hypothetical protein [Alphaproteobacteria bacterium]